MSRSTTPVWAPQPDDYRQVFNEQNPWHTRGSVPEVLARPVERSLAQHLWRRLEMDQPRRYQVVLGPRRVGKSTALYQTVRHLLQSGISPQRLWWLRMDHPLLMAATPGDLVRGIIHSAGASETQPLYLFMDELTYGREWDLWLKTFYDENWPIRLAGSSSSSAALRERRVESGVGRWEEQYLAPYPFTEFLALIGRPISVPVQATLADTLAACTQASIDLAGLEAQRRRFLLTGGFPELLIAEKEHPVDEASMLLRAQGTLRSDAVERAVYKDIPQAFGVNDPLLLERLLYVLAGQIGGILSPNTICRTLAGLSQPTFDRYLSYLERAYLVFTVPNYSGTESSRQKRGRKLYFVDGAVRNAALQRGIAPLSDLREMGMLMENLAAAHLHGLSQQSQVRVYHWRDKSLEVDLVYDHPELPLAFEIASSAAHHREGLCAFATRYPRFQGRCFLVAPVPRPLAPAASSDGVGIVPLDLFLLAVGAQAERELTMRLGVG